MKVLYYSNDAGANGGKGELKRTKGREGGNPIPTKLYYGK